MVFRSAPTGRCYYPSPVNHSAADRPASDPDFDLSDPAWTSRSLPALRRLRERAPIHRSQIGTWAFGWCPAMPTAWPCCGTGGPAPTPSMCPRVSAGRAPTTTPWPSPGWRCDRSSSVIRPTIPACAAWWPRRSPRRWSNRCGIGPSGWSTTCWTTFWTTFGTPVRSTSSRSSPRPCLFGSSVTCSASPSTTGTSSGNGRTPWPGDSTPTSSCPTTSWPPGMSPWCSSPRYFFELLADRAEAPRLRICSADLIQVEDGGSGPQRGRDALDLHPAYWWQGTRRR